jgi:hypothetical protein
MSALRNGKYWTLGTALKMAEALAREPSGLRKIPAQTTRQAVAPRWLTALADLKVGKGRGKRALLRGQGPDKGDYPKWRSCGIFRLWALCAILNDIGFLKISRITIAGSTGFKVEHP